ncbi:unnamed protein product [Prorocentrum cordatum]|uniref:Uncharacterized protein n=1 Tax=Prorocentrum cordatum TaxID=2364126 RepID=A0ABN9UQD2_9DINO|nr:unnamed protein product [Polarella glacialis]
MSAAPWSGAEALAPRPPAADMISPAAPAFAFVLGAAARAGAGSFLGTAPVAAGSTHRWYRREPTSPAAVRQPAAGKTAGRGSRRRRCPAGCCCRRAAQAARGATLQAVVEGIHNTLPCDS